MTKTNAITDVRGVEVGHAQNEQAFTGCTVILCRKGAVAGVDVRGGAPGTRETDLLDPVNLVQKAHAIVLAGGSAYGLDAATGVVRYLEENRIGFKTGEGRVPIVPAAILYDLGVGRADGGVATPKLCPQPRPTSTNARISSHTCRRSIGTARRISGFGR